jgi:hypothetical protein
MKRVYYRAPLGPGNPVAKINQVVSDAVDYTRREASGLREPIDDTMTLDEIQEKVPDIRMNESRSEVLWVRDDDLPPGNSAVSGAIDMGSDAAAVRAALELLPQWETTYE